MYVTKKVDLTFVLIEHAVISFLSEQAHLSIMRSCELQSL